MNNNPNQEKRMQNQSFNRGGRMRGQFSGVKEKPKDLKTSIKRLAGYIALNKKIFIILLVVVLLNTYITLYTNILVKDVINSLGTINDKFEFTKNPDQSAFFLSLILLGIAHLLHSVLQYLSSLLSAHLSVFRYSLPSHQRLNTLFITQLTTNSRSLYITLSLAPLPDILY